jgi:phosphoglucosamine mutase
MKRKLFGTDGIRGTANSEPMTAETALKVGMGAGAHFKHGDHRHRAVISKDTRLSGYLLEPALTAGFISVGMDVILVGPLPTPAVAMLTRSLRADVGVMISASHNPFQDNGIKLFSADGFKLSDQDEAEIEKRVTGEMAIEPVASEKLGKARRLDGAGGRYVEYVKQSFPRGLRLEGMKVVVDCANGAAYRVAPEILRELGADVISIGIDPDGFNINKDCGSTATETMRGQVILHGADIGLSLDGDADRVLVSDENGDLIDGDQMMGLIARQLAGAGQLKGNGVVATVMSNLGLERHLAAQDLKLIRTQVGDRYVVEHMRQNGFNLGGEQSGHIILGDYATTGDGLIAGLQVLAAVATAGKPASEVCKVFDSLPQVLKNVRYASGDPLTAERVLSAIAAAEKELQGTGRLLIRKSGTEPLIRVMAEGEDEGQIGGLVDELIGVISDVATKEETGV